MNSDTAQKIHQRLLIRRAERPEARRGAGPLTAVQADRVGETARPAVVQEMRAVRNSPERRRSKFTAGRGSLLEPVREI